MNHRIDRYLAVAAVTPMAGAIAAHADSFFHHYGGDTPFLTLSLPDLSDVANTSAALTTSKGLFSIGFGIDMAGDSQDFVAGMYFQSDSNAYGAFHCFDMGTSKAPGISRLEEGDKLPNPDAIKNEFGKLAKEGNGDFAGEGEQRGYVGATIGLGEDFELEYVALAWFDIGLNADEGTLTIYDWAWTGVDMDSPVPPILYAGQTEASTPVPGPAGIMALAAGAAGIRRRRQRAS